MRIPLDYYRIIGLPLQATAEQIEQAYQDRLRQTPHSEYTQETLTARKELLDLAYAVLSDPEQRSEYDANYLLTAYEVEEGETVALPHIQNEEEEAFAVTSHTPMLDLTTPEQLLSALLILYELGEYQRVRQLAEWVLTHPDRAFPQDDHQLSSSLQKDLILTLALSCWELGRELWRQEAYEAAGEVVTKGQQLLVDWDLFPHIRREMAVELDKLCPYRIFELVSQRETGEEAVGSAIALLQGMFDKRGGLDGELPDDSGLDIDEFLRFVQQIREYLTAAEQEELFSREAQRPSAVAQYLAACAGIARGFAYWQPHYILKAQGFLKKLEREQATQDTRADVYLEESICALLLGDTENAVNLLEKSQETDSIAQIQAYAAEAGDTPDLLLGLCNYAEEWLESVLFPKFFDLTNHSPALKDYFASESVQSTLESFQDDPPSPEAGLTENAPTSFFSHQGNVSPSLIATDHGSQGLSQENSDDFRRPRNRRPKRRLRFTSKRSRIIALVGVTGVGLGAIILVLFGLYQGTTALWATLFKNNSPQLNGEPLALELNAPPLDLPAQSKTAPKTLNRDRAEAIVRNWLRSKASALGPEHEATALQTILVNPLLSEWQALSQRFDNNNWYQQFRHSVSIDSFAYAAENPDQGQITATVREVARFYRNGRLTESNVYSYDSTLKVRYDVVRKNENWHIQGIQVLNN